MSLSAVLEGFNLRVGGFSFAPRPDASVIEYDAAVFHSLDT